MKTIVVGGQARNVGKTSVMANLIRGLHWLNWTAVKITQYGHGICSLDGTPCGCAPGEHPFALTEEKNAAGHSDTCRYLAAGARRSLWLRVRQGELREAWPALQQALEREAYVAMESNSIVALLKPDVYLAVVDSTVKDFKLSAKRYFALADALVPIVPETGKPVAPLLAVPFAATALVFPVPRGKYTSLELCQFVRGRLGV
jgi:hypothetical protein